MSGSSAIGSVITISASALKAIDDVDKKLQSLQTTMTDTAKKANTEFTNMATATKSFSQTLDDIIAKMGKVGTSAQSIASSMQGAWGSITAGSGSAAVSVQQLANALKSMSGTGTSGIQSAALNFEKLENAAKNASGMNIAELKDAIKQINGLLTNKDNNLSGTAQDKWVAAKSNLEQELKYQLQTIAERKVAHQKAVDQMISAEERLAKKQQSLYKGNAASYQTQNYKANTTYSGALQFSDTANTINRQTKAIEFLEAAKKRLSSTDAEYTVKLQTLNTALDKHKQSIQEASVAAQKNNERELYLSNSSQVVTNNSSVKTLREHTEAIKELEKARLTLDTTDKNYKTNLLSINEAIERHTQILKEAKGYTSALQGAKNGTQNISDSGLSKSVAEWKALQVQISQYTQRQKELTQAVKQYELVSERKKSGKGGVLSMDDKRNYAANIQELEANKKVIASLQEKQQAIITNNQALRQQEQIISALKSYSQDSGSLNNLRSQDTLASMREYYTQLEKSSKKAAEEEQKEAETIAKAEAKKREEWNKSTAAYAQLHHNEQQSMYSQLFSSQNMTASSALANSNSARTLRESASAIKDLEQARENLSRTDADYEKKLQALNEAIIKNKQALEAASTATASKNARESYLSNTSQVLADTGSAKTLQQHTQAIKELEQARLRLNTTDANYKRNLSSVNEAIRQHSQALREAGINANNLREQTSYLAQYIERWATRTAALFSINFAQNAINQIVEVRGQFEMSQRSLEAILQDKSKADEIFNKTVELAVQSPFQIKDLVDYTRQLSAYRIESDKLYDTTKRLADVSAGLGVDMGRLILAYGQVKAAAYLRGSEVRQFTEAGINMYGELQSYFKEVKGEAYTTEQIVDMISKRMVSFADVEQVFQRMTDKGGTFYNMQAIQAETLQGKVANLKDSLDVMLNSIGKDNEGMLKGAVSTATELLNHWEGIATVTKGVAGTLALMLLYAKQMGAVKLTNVFTEVIGKGDSIALMNSGIATLKASFANLGKTITIVGTNLRNAFASNAPLLVLTALVSAVGSYVEGLREYNKTISESGLKLYESTAQVNTLSEAYAKVGANAKDSGKSEVSVLSEKKKLLQDLINAAGKDGLSIDINMSVVGADNIDKVFKDTEAKYTTFLNNIALIRANLAGNKELKDHWYMPVDDIDTDAKDYSAAASELMSRASKLTQMVDIISGHMDEATESTKRYYEEVKAGKKAGEDELDYYERMYNLVIKIGKIDGATFGGSETGKMAKNFSQSYVTNAAGELKIARQELEGEIRDTFDAVEQDIARKFGRGSKDYRIQMKAYIDQTEYDNFFKNLAKKIYHVNVEPKANKGNVEREVLTIIKDLQHTADANKITLSVDVSKAQNLTNTIGNYQNAAKSWQETIEDIKRSEKEWFAGAYLDISNSKKWGSQRVDSQTVFDKKTALKYAEQQRDAALYWNKVLGGTDPLANNKTAKSGSDSQRDLLNERIQLLKDLASKYEELSKWETKSKALTDVRSYFSDAAKNVGMDITSFVPDKETVAKKIKAIAQQYKELTKRGSGLRIAADLQFDVDKENLKNQLESIKNDIQNSLDSLTLFRKLKDLGLDKDTIKRMFGDEFVESFTDVRTKIQDSYNSKFGSDSSKWAPEVFKQYEEEIKKLDKQQYDEQISQFTELTKAYKTQLTEQLQLDQWYAEEKEKIQNNTNLQKNPILKQQYQSNLDKQYRTKTDENTWKQFTGTNTYIEMFQNLEYTSLAAVDSMLAQLERLKESLKGLEPEQVKTIVSQMEKLRDIKMNRYSLVGFAQSMQDIIKAQKEYVAAKDEYVAAQKEKEAADLELKLAEAGLNAVEDQRTLLSDTEYNTLIIENQENVAQAMERVKTATEALNTAQDNVASKSNRVTNTWMRFGNQIKTVASGFKTAASSLNTLISTISGKASTKTQKWINLIGETTSAVGDVIKAYKDLKNKATKSIEEISDKSKNTVNDVGSASEQVTEKIKGAVTDASGAIVSTSTAASAAIQAIEKASVILAIISAALQVAQAIADIFSDEGDIDDFIDSQQLKIEKLQNAYDTLKESVDNAFDINKLKEYSKQTEANLKKQIALIESQILAEKSRKSPDESTIAGYEEDIEELKEKIKELGETVTEELGGFGSDSNYKSAAEAFAEAWVDAFNDCSSGIEALTDKWDEYFDTLITKQLMMRATTKYIQPLLKAVDAALEETSDGGTALTKSETEYIQKLREASLAGFDEYASELMDALNIKPRGSVELSGLQEGIEGVTEATAQALESILNSMRYYLATQQADVRTIRDTLISRLGSVSGAVQGTSGESSQMITILQEQTGYLKTLANNFDKVIKPNHSKGGSGIKVFLN